MGKREEPEEPSAVFSRATERLLAAVKARELAEAATKEAAGKARDSPAEEFDLQGIYDRLVAAFGWGDRAEERKALYVRLVKAVSRYGAAAYATIDEVAEASVGLGKPDRFFTKVVVARFRERGMSLGERDRTKPAW